MMDRIINYLNDMDEETENKIAAILGVIILVLLAWGFRLIFG